MAWSIKEAAQETGLSEKTIRNYIKAGKVQARLVSGLFGDEWELTELPDKLNQASTLKRSANKNARRVDELEAEVALLNRRLSAQEAQIADLRAERDKLYQDNMTLARMAGQLEAKAGLLDNKPHKSWWQRLFGK